MESGGAAGRNRVKVRAADLNRESEATWNEPFAAELATRNRRLIRASVASLGRRW
jgi:hypothetical protein